MAPSSGSDSDRTADFWDRAAQGPHRHAYYAVPGFLAEFNQRVSGDPAVGYVEWLARSHRFGPDSLGLVIGCGTAGDELALLEHGIVDRVEALDISPASVAKAEEQARERGLDGRATYRVANAEHDPLGEQRYDLVAAFGCVHHIDRLEAFYDHIARALKPGGLLYLVEYVGPTRFQWPAPQRQACDEVLARIPRRLRHRRIYPGWYVAARSIYAGLGGPHWLGRLAHGAEPRPGLLGRIRGALAEVEANPLRQDRITPPTLASFARCDPSEAIRSGDVVPVLERRFDIVTRRDLGLSLVQPVLNGIASNFDPEDAEAMRALQTVFDADRAARDAGLSDFVALIARPRAADA